MNAAEDTPPQKAEKRIKAVLFDLGDTLIEFGRIDKAQIFAEAARLTYDYLKGLNQPVGSFKTYAVRNLLNIRLRRFISALKRRDFNSLELLQRVGTRKGINLTADQWRRLIWLWYKPLTKIGRTEPETKQTLTALKDSGLKLGIVSNTFVHAGALEKHMEQLGILEFFDVRLYSYEFPFRKPDLRIFKRAAERLGCPPRNILFVGDRIDKDIKPAMRIGMIAALKEAYTNKGKTNLHGAAKITKIADLPALIEKINAQIPVMPSAAEASI